MTIESLPARDGEEFAAHPNSGRWILTWHPPSSIPDGTPHGAAGICLTADGGLVLISLDGKRWGLPARRPEAHESWEQTLRREMLEEACATVTQAQLLGFGRGVCIEGHEEGLVLVRSWWRAEVELGPWKPQFEIPHRLVVPAEQWSAHLWMNHGFAPIYRRAFAEAGVK